MISRRVVLTGRGVVSPLGIGIERHAEALAAGERGVRTLEGLADLGLATSRGAAVAGEWLAPHLGRLNRKQQKLSSRATLLAMVAAALAMDEAGLAAGAPDPSRFGVVLGINVLSWDLVAMTEYLRASESAERPGILDMAAANAFCMRHINPLDYSLKTLPNLAVGHLAITHGARGICRAFTEGSMGGTHAVGQAYRLIQESDLDVALAGGTDALLEPLLYATLGGAELSGADDGSRPGPALGEGSGLLVLEEAAHACARGARAHAELAGFAAAAGHGRLPAEEEPDALGRRLAAVIRAALHEADGAPDVVCLHGDGLPAHDEAEALALDEALGSPRSRVPAVRMKPAHGDLGAASGPVELLACAAGLTPGQRALGISLGTFGECAVLVVRATGDTDAD